MFKKKCKMFPELFEWLMTLCDLGEGEVAEVGDGINLKVM